MNHADAYSTAAIDHRSFVAAVLLLGLLAGCTNKPSQANILLRKENQSLHAQLAQFETRQAADDATIKALESTRGIPPAITSERVQSLFTVHSISILNLTGGVDLSPDKPGDDAIKVYAVPLDETGDELKAAGSFVIEAFESPGQPPIGHWEFSTEDARKNWIGFALLYEYVLTCPLDHGPSTGSVTLKVTFRDGLTGREFSAEKAIALQR